MYNIIKTLSRCYFQWRTWRDRERVRQLLLKKSEWALIDMGLSSALLRRGVRAWPWRQDDEPGRRRGALRQH